MSTIATTIDLIQTVNRSIITAWGRGKAPPLASYPLKLDTADAPLVITVPGRAQWSRQQFGSKKRTDRPYRVIVFVAPLGQNELPARIDDTVRLISAFEDTWLAVDAQGYPTALQDPTNAGDRQITFVPDATEDGGLAVDLQIGGVPWSGFEIQLGVREQW